jgi:LEA14-like dessication related protein
MIQSSRLIAPLLLAGLLVLNCGCAWLPQSSLPPPEVEVMSITPLAWHGLDKQFVIELRISNPGDVALDISGIDCDLSIENRKLLHSISKTFPSIEPHNQETYSVLFTGNVRDSAKLLRYVAKHKKDTVSYEVSGKLHLRGWLTRPLSFTSAGSFTPKRH